MRFVVAALVLWGGWARADEPAPNASCDLRVIQALKEGSIDERITRLRPYLERAPFTAWHGFKLLDDKQAQVAPHGSTEFDLPTGHKATVSYLEHLLAPNGEHRLRLRIKIDSPKNRVDTTITLDEAGMFMVAGQKYQAGLLIFGFSCKTEK